MAFGDVLHVYEATGLSGEASVTISTTPTAGNLLIGGVGRGATHTSGGSWGLPWTAIHDSGINVGALGGAWSYRYADASETAWTTAGVNPAGGWQAMVIEFEGPFATSPLDVAAENATLIGTIGTTISSGTTAASTQNDALAIAFFSADRQDQIDGSRTYSNSFTEANFTDLGGARATCFAAAKVLSATGTQECTFSCTDTGDEMYGSIAVFKKLVAASKAMPRLRRPNLYIARRTYG